ncbi:hypothetical protein [Streptomyces aurantiogriseus]|uniref:Cysteinyl-tRNA synthetase n=1 Tax=Streptomyces aurantiogriseus TaxID=66870 RepID=A0A918FEE7_9ACTN|nr:hypothetical protein [Streptomyces aurantiogriseus]GGR28152.1 hypothetical protein GCM10010251_50300 [Streptomyces aurantiogriseus]
MLRIIDARTGEPVAAAPVRRGLTRVEAHASGYGAGTLRVLLVADLLVRVLELGGTPVLALLTGESQQPELRSAGTTLGIRPFEDGWDFRAGIGEAQALHVVREGDAEPEGVRIAVAPVLPAAPAAPAEPAADPAVLRLALLSRHHRDPVPLDADALREAHDTLVRWRRAVAGWARRPSRPVPDEVRGRLRTAWEDDLDLPAVLNVLRSVEEAGPELPDGARFETYAYADRLLGLELTRDLGAPA